MHTDRPKSNVARSWPRAPLAVGLPTLLCAMVCAGDDPATVASASEGLGASNLEVRLDGVWRGVCCTGSALGVADRDCRWTEHDRTLTDETEGLKVDCPEGGPADCECNGHGERLHGIDGAHLDASIGLPDGGPMYSNYQLETCVVVGDDGALKTAWTSSSCPAFRLR